MPNIKPHISTSSYGLRQKGINSYNKPTTTSYDQSYFPLQPTQFPSGTPETSVRSKKVYSDLLDERTFLLELRERWVQKLQDLKEDHKFLSKMKSVKKNEALGTELLFAREEKESTPPPPPVIPAPCLPPLQYPTISSNPIVSQPSSPASRHNIPQPSPNQLHTLDDFDLDNDNFTMNEPDILNAFEELEGLFSDDDEDDNEDEDEEEEEEEDEERARIALNLMLQEFGNSI